MVRETKKRLREDVARLKGQVTWLEEALDNQADAYEQAETTLQRAWEENEMLSRVHGYDPATYEEWTAHLRRPQGRNHES